MKIKEVYLDTGATSKVDPEVLKAMLPFFSDKYGNAASMHSMGNSAKEALEKSRKIIAEAINAETDEIFFTSGGTESNNWAVKGIAFANKNKGAHIITTKVEHKCVLNSCKWLESQGFEVTYLDVDKDGFVSAVDLENAITKKTVLVSVIHGNNEIGTIQDLNKLSDVCKKHRVYFHTDACQSFAKTCLNVKEQGLDLVSLNAHKIHGPKGVGALFVREGVKIVPWLHGGGQEKNRRSGTENIPGVVGFAEAVNLADKREIRQMTMLRTKLIDGVLKIKGVRLNGPKGDRRLCNNANFSFKGVEGEAIAVHLEQKGIYSSTGSACSSNVLEPSYVLKAIGLNNEDCNGSLRLTLSRFTSVKDIDYFLKVLPGIIQKLRKISPIGRGFL